MQERLLAAQQRLDWNTTEMLLAPLTMREVGRIGAQVSVVNGLGREFAEEAYTDLRLILAASKLEEANEFTPLIQRMLSAYLAGAFPCGWAGEWPRGELVCFVRSEK